MSAGVVLLSPWRQFIKLSQKNLYHSLCEGAVGMISQLPVASPVGHVCADREPSLLSQHLFDQFSTGHVHNHQRPILRLPQGTIDLAMFNLMAWKI